MPITVFYCWQSDRDQVVCHYLIRDATLDAMKRLKVETEAHVEEAPAFPDMVLDHDTKGVPGIPKVADVIQKKIAACDVFIADVTHATAYTTDDGRAKKGQNGNVLIELGHALAQKPPERILLVMNTAFGSFDGLPFDLHLHRKPIQYHLADASDRTMVKNARKGLTDKFVEALRLMLEEIGRAAAAEFRRIDAAEEVRLRGQAKAKWEVFFNKLISWSYRDLPQASYLMASIIPLRPPAVKLDLAEFSDKGMLRLPPIGSPSYDIDLRGRSVVHHNGRRAHGDREAEPPTTVVEITEDGSIFAAADVFITTLGPNETQALALENEERQLFAHLSKSVSLQRRLGVTGPLEVRVSLVGVKDAQLHPARVSLWNPRDFRPLSEDVVHLDPVMLGEGVTGDSSSTIAEAMRPGFTVVWRDAGVPLDPCFTTDGRYDASRS